MISAGIDLGGTKIEAQLFDADWALIDKHRIATPTTYPELIVAVASQIDWVRSKSATCPIGIGAAGLVTKDGHALTANLPATGERIVDDISARSGQVISYINDCRAFALSEAVFGAGQSKKTVVGLILGTGVGAGICVDGRLIADPRAVGGEIGHIAAPASVLMTQSLPLFGCGCGRIGCYESYVSGPGLVRIVKSMTGQDVTPPQVAALRLSDPLIEAAWQVWLDITAELVVSVIMCIEPDVVILGGGLSQIQGVCAELSRAVDRAHLPGFMRPEILLAQGGDSSGGRGAALAAWQEQTQ